MKVYWCTHAQTKCVEEKVWTKQNKNIEGTFWWKNVKCTFQVLTSRKKKWLIFRKSLLEVMKQHYLHIGVLLLFLLLLLPVYFFLFFSLSFPFFSFFLSFFFCGRPPFFLRGGAKTCLEYFLFHFWKYYSCTCTCKKRFSSNHSPRTYPYLLQYQYTLPRAATVDNDVFHRALHGIEKLWDIEQISNEFYWVNGRAHSRVCFLSFPSSWLHIWQFIMSQMIKLYVTFPTIGKICTQFKMSLFWMKSRV